MTFPAANRRAHDVTTRGARVRFIEVGEGPTVLFIHGLFGSHRTWEELPPMLPNLRLLFLDLPGCGESEKPSSARYSYHLDALTDATLDVAAAAGASRFILCGHGLGGAIALNVAARHPELVKGLVVVAPTVYEPSLTFLRWAGFPVVRTALFKQLIGPTIFERLLFSRVYANATEATTRRVRDGFTTFNSPQAREAALATFTSNLDRRALVALLPLVRTRSLVFWGSADNVVPIEQGRRLVHEISGARFEVLNCGHAPQEECPHEFAHALERFIASDETPAAPKRRGSLRS